MNFGSAVQYWARWRGDADAIVFEGERMSWSAFDDRARRLAGGLSELGIGSGDRVGILALNHPAWCEATIAVLRVGAIVVPLNIRLSSRELEYIVTHAGCRAVVVDDTLAPTLRPVIDANPEIVTIGLGDVADVDHDLADLDGAHTLDADTAPDDPALIAYTSGTTGLPKGATITHANLLAHVTQKAFSDGWSSEVSALLPVPLAFTGGIVNNFLIVFGVGGTLVLERDFVPDRAFELLVSERCSVMMGVPIMWQGIAAVDGFDDADLSSITTAMTGGAPVPESLLRTYQAKGVAIRQAYGLTEATGLVTQLPPALASERPDAAGIPNLHTAVRIVNDADEDVDSGEVGEIIVRGPQVMSGYWNDPEATAEALAGGWLHTGDLGRIDETGLLQVVDRKKDMVISGGLNIYPAEIERVVEDHPGVVESAAFGVPSERWGEAVALVVLGDGIDPAALEAHCRHDLADYKVPKHIVVTDAPLPRSMSGKVLRRELRDAYADLDSTGD